MSKAAREALLLDIAKELILEDGVMSFKFVDIAKRAGVSRATLYNHFSGKEDVVVSLFVRDAGETKKMLLQIQADDNLNDREKLVLSQLAPVAGSMETQNRFGTTLLSANPGIFMFASEAQQARLELIVTQIRSIILDFWLTPFKQGHMKVSQAELEEIMASVFPYQRGCVIIPQNVMTAGKHINYTLRKVYDNLVKSTDSLNWVDVHTNIDYEKTLIAIGKHKIEGMIAC